MALLTPAGPRRRGLVWLQAMLVLLLGVTGAFGGQFDEYDVKAAFLLNFAKFVEWPAEKDSERVVICIVGDDPFGTNIDRLARSTGQPRAIEIRRINAAAEVVGCHIAFVRSAERHKARTLANSSGAEPVLTVGEVEEFTEQGGVACLPIEDKRVKVVINTAAAERAHLRISAKLLSLARLVSDRRGKD